MLGLWLYYRRTQKKPIAQQKLRAFLGKLKIFYDDAIDKRLRLNKGDVPIGFNFNQLELALQPHKSSTEKKTYEHCKHYPPRTHR